MQDEEIKDDGKHGFRSLINEEEIKVEDIEKNIQSFGNITYHNSNLQHMTLFEVKETISKREHKYSQ